MNGLLKDITDMAVFLVCAQTLLHFRAKDSYEKYIRLLISMMLLLLLITPVLELLGAKGNNGFWDKITSYEQKMEEVMGKGLLQEEEIEELLQQITKKNVETGVGYVQSLQESNAPEETGGTDAMPGQTESPIVIEKIEIGGSHGEF